MFSDKSCLTYPLVPWWRIRTLQGFNVSANLSHHSYRMSFLRLNYNNHSCLYRSPIYQLNFPLMLFFFILDLRTSLARLLFDILSTWPSHLNLLILTQIEIGPILQQYSMCLFLFSVARKLLIHRRYFVLNVSLVSCRFPSSSSSVLQIRRTTLWSWF